MSAPKVLICGFDTTGAGTGFENPVAVDANGNIAVTVRDPFNPVIEPNVVLVNADGENPNGPSFAAGLETATVLYGLNPAGNFDRLRSNDSTSDAIVPDALGVLQTLALQMGFDGTNFERIRVANVFKTLLTTSAGNKIVWTPAGGKKFRLMGYTISVAGTLAATGVELIELTDGAGGPVIAQHQATVTITTPTGDTQIGADLGQGYPSILAGNSLEINLSSAMLTGGVAINVWGTEE